MGVDESVEGYELSSDGDRRNFGLAGLDAGRARQDEQGEEE